MKHDDPERDARFYVVVKTDRTEFQWGGAVPYRTAYSDVKWLERTGVSNADTVCIDAPFPIPTSEQVRKGLARHGIILPR